MKERKCISCKNNFVGKFHKYKKEKNEWYEWAYWEKRWMIMHKEPTNPSELYDDEYCIYTRDYEVYAECSFYNRNPLFVELVQEKELEVDGNGYQDIDRTFTNTERTISTRIDCQDEQLEAAN